MSIEIPNLDGIIVFIKNLKFYYWIMPIFFGFIIYFFKWIKLEFRFGKNLKRKIYFLKVSETKTLQTQKDKIKNLKLFNLEEDIKDISQNLDVLQNLKDNAVYIVGYDPGHDYKQLFEKAEPKNIPILIFANQGEIKKDWGLFNGYIYCDIANTTNRLVIILLNILKIV